MAPGEPGPGAMMTAMNPNFDAALRDADVVEAEPLRLPSGRLVAAEPPGLFGPGQVGDWAFIETVPPGEYPVQVLYRHGEVIAARMIVRPEPVHEWRPARCVAHPEWERCYFPVDGGTGSFGSAEVFEALSGDPEACEDLVADLSFDVEDPYMSYLHEDGHNLIAFRLGGDGRFATWVGYTMAGTPVCFLTDYGNLADGDD